MKVLQKFLVYVEHHITCDDKQTCHGENASWTTSTVLTRTITIAEEPQNQVLVSISSFFSAGKLVI